MSLLLLFTSLSLSISLSQILTFHTNNSFSTFCLSLPNLDVLFHSFSHTLYLFLFVFFLSFSLFACSLLSLGTNIFCLAIFYTSFFSLCLSLSQPFPFSLPIFFPLSLFYLSFSLVFIFLSILCLCL